MTISIICLEATRHFVRKFQSLLGLKEYSFFLNHPDHMTKIADRPVDRIVKTFKNR